MNDELDELLLLSFGGTSPRLAEPPILRGPRAAILGRVEAGSRIHLSEASVIRADGHFVRIGEDFWLGDHSTVHIAHDLYPTLIGDRVIVGARSVVHACTIGSDSVVEDDVVILDGSVVGEGVIIEAGSVVFPRSQLLCHGVYAGRPVQRVLEVTPEELERRGNEVRSRPIAQGRRATSPPGAATTEVGVFVARTAQTRGRILCQTYSSIWFSCDIDAGEGEIRIGAETNIQDNTVVHAMASGVTIGPKSVVGHNVILEDCTIGTRSLIGIGSFVARGTVVENDVLLAAGGRTTEGQILQSGWLWGGSPARKLAKLDNDKQRMIAWTVDTYREYAAAFARIQAGS